jgi:hypothetical protein
MTQFCINCGKEVKNELDLCPSCNHPIYQHLNDINKIDEIKKVKRFAVLSIVFGVLGIYPLIGIGGIMGMIIAKKGLRSPYKLYQKQLKLGFWISLFGSIFWAIALVITIVIFIMPILEFLWQLLIYYLRLLFGK